MNPALRESPPQSKGLFVRIIQAICDDPRQMTPIDAMKELVSKVNAYFDFDQREEPNFDWLNRVNQLLWVLTSKGKTLVDEEKDLQVILRIWETATSIYHDRKYRKENSPTFAKKDPFKSDISLEEVLLQIRARCKVLELLYIKVHGSDSRIKELSDALQAADGKIGDLTYQLRGTLEEEKRLADKLRINCADAIRSELSQQFEKLKEQYAAELAKQEAVLQQLHVRELQLKSENSLLRSENRSLQERYAQMSYQIRSLEEENNELRSVKSKGGEVEVVHDVEESLNGDSKELLKTLRTENARLSEENKQLMGEREDVIAHYDATMALRAKILVENGKHEETLEARNSQIQAIRKAHEIASKTYREGSDNPLVHSEVLYILLEELDSILNK